MVKEWQVNLKSNDTIVLSDTFLNMVAHPPKRRGKKKKKKKSFAAFIAFYSSN